MLTRESFEARENDLLAAMKTKLGVRKRPLAAALRRAGRRLPKSARAQGRVLEEARRKLIHPRIARQVDPVRVQRAFDTISEQLDKIDPKERRKDAMLHWLAALILNMILLGAVIAAVLYLLGHL
ncbi:MAG: hypothetical protein AAGA28_12185 [Pseudomonadota bacterium]